MALDVNEIRNGIREMLQLALDSVNCLNHFCRPLWLIVILHRKIYCSIQKQQKNDRLLYSFSRK